MDVEEIIRNNTGLIFFQMKKLHLLNDPEAESLGYEALYKAAITYQEDNGTKFNTYASVCIYNALGTYIRFLKRKRQLEVVSYHNLSGDSELINSLSVETNIEAEYIRKESISELHSCIHEAYLELVSTKQIEIIDKWIELGWDSSSSDIAKEVGSSQPYAHQILAAFKTKVRRKYNDRNS